MKSMRKDNPVETLKIITLIARICQKYLGYKTTA